MFDSGKREESDADRALKREKRANTQPVSFEVFAHLIGLFNVAESDTSAIKFKGIHLNVWHTIGMWIHSNKKSDLLIS